MIANTTLRALAAAALLSFVACKASDAPEEPAWGKQPCGHCAMLVEDRRSAAEVIAASGERKFFDDVGCMVAWIDESKTQPRKSWVRSPSGDGWIDAKSARYVKVDHTPMDYGFVPGNGGVSWDEMANAVRTRVADGGPIR